MKVKFDEKGLVPVIAQDCETNKVLMLAYANKEALDKTVQTRDAWYWSRSRKQLWRKGEGSGNTQAVVDILSDCDSDALIYRVKQNGVACHLGNYSCFRTILDEVYGVIQDRARNPTPDSYTCKLIRDKEKILRKINEEAYELVLAAKEGNKKEIVWETADLLYFVLVLLAVNNVGLGDVWSELRRRRK
ncbi:MAG: bifunctional phosphoribosyl-AMP cyclohydrolase/phosphoribosyl-ATP diphosphatase HisIE [Candidatus Diapherotrites archaeon]|nr:bifunctional phosphoribosyl-AMP cyclohydrolase/phosphoribosyl-ATP diphosphatase HisIE [Candidatus Diapherotrites archaeon]